MNPARAYSKVPATNDDAQALAELRVAAMRESLEAVGRFDPERARRRFLDGFDASRTTKLLVDNELAGFYVTRRLEDCLFLDHLYVLPSLQKLQLGSGVMTDLQAEARRENLPIRLGALRGSRANDFYRRHGFEQTHEETWDIYYEWKARG